MNRVAILGAGPVGLATAAQLTKQRNNQIELLDIDDTLIGSLRAPRFQIPDYDTRELDILWQKVFRSSDVSRARKADYVIVCVPAPMDKTGTTIDTTEVKRVVMGLLKESEATVVIRSTLPIGYCLENFQDYTDRVVYWPEFIRDRHFMSDSMDAEFVVGGPSPVVRRFVESCLMLRSSMRYYINQQRLLITGYREAEGIKLLRNTYLAGRVAFMNLVAGACNDLQMSMLDVFTGVTGDKRIGNKYANSSFGFAGKCLPKDVATVAGQVEGISSLPKAYLEDNEMRQQKIAARILSEVPHGKVVGLISLETDPDEFDAVWEVARLVRKRGYHRVIVLSSCTGFNKEKIENVCSIDALSRDCDVVYSANRWVDVPGSKMI